MTELDDYINKIEIVVGKGQKQGAILLYTIPDVDEKYQKYGLFSEFKIENYNDNCLIVVLQNANIDENHINNVRVLTKGLLYIP